MRVAVIGATGLIGSLLLPRLKTHHLLILARRSTGRPDVGEKIGPIDQWVEFLRDEQLDVAVSTIGTTWRKAPNWQAFDADLVAAAIAEVVGRPEAGVYYHLNSQIRALANA